MNRLLRNTFLSVCAANFAALNFYMIFLVYRNTKFKVISVSQVVGGYFEIAALFFTIGLVISLIISILVGWPLYWIARRTRMVNWVVSLFSGILVAVAPWGLLIMFNWNLPSIFEQNGLLTISLLAICGAIGGMFFYKLDLKWSNNKPVSERNFH
jgi:uncharacterized protein YacL